jgi:non-lysosomal glucosylceramidase
MVMEGAPVSGAGFEAALEDPADPRALTLRGLAVGRAIHDRYAPAKRNPYNEIECSDHYARAAASWSLLLAVSGFQYHGPRGEIGFAPKLDPEGFRGPFTAAEGWGTFAQNKAGAQWTATLQVRHGRLRLRTLRLPWLGTGAGPEVRWNGREVDHELAPGRVSFKQPLVLAAGDTLALG